MSLLLYTVGYNITYEVQQNYTVGKYRSLLK